VEPLFVFLVALGTTVILTPAVRAVARAMGKVAQPTADRWHNRPTALFGGVGMFLGFVAAVALGASLLTMQAWAPVAEHFPRQALGIVVAATIMFVTGLADDLMKMRPTSKLVLQALAGAALVTAGVHFALTPWSPVNVVFTLFWFIALTNALNLLDNMDGVTAGVTGVSALFLATLFGLSGEWLYVALALALAGAAFGFLPYNVRPASIFMGDAGSLFHGAMLAGLGAAYTMVGTPPASGVALIPMLIVIVPILDTGLVTLTRTLAGHPITRGGRDHIAHRLVRMGLRESRAALLLSALAAGGGLFAILIAFRPGPVTMWLGAFYVLALVVFGAYLSHLYIYPAEAARSRPIGRILLEELLFRRRLLPVLLDLVIFAIAYTGAYLLRYDGTLPVGQAVLLETTLALAVGCKSVAFLITGVYRGVWSQASLPDLHRVVRGTFLGALFTMAAVVFLFRDAEFARSIFILDGMIAGLLALGLRASFRSLEAVRYSLNGVGARTLVYGAGKAGEVVLRELFSSPDLKLHPVGFIDDEPTKSGRSVHGVPVLGTERELRDAIEKHAIEKVIISTEKVATDRMNRVYAVCRSCDIDVLRLQLRIVPLIPHPNAAAKRSVSSLEPEQGTFSLQTSTRQH
jgi:UDP-GlcNAc:undecaprenyl-phosphate/decaprenyl-phosphate GlcNAc-1-phosphate transferase